MISPAFMTLQEAFATFDRMLGLGVEPDVVTMNLVIKAAGAAGRLETVEQLYSQMMSIGPSPTSITFVHLFAAFQNSLRKDYAWLSQVCQKIKDAAIISSDLLPCKLDIAFFDAQD